MGLSMTNSMKYRLTISIPAFAVVTIQYLFLIFFFSTLFVNLSSLYIQFFLSTVIVMLLFNILTIKFQSLLKKKLPTPETNAVQFRSGIILTGKMPLVSLIIFIIIFLIHQAVLYFILVHIKGLTMTLAFAFSGAGFAFAMLGGGFIYVLLDKTVSRLLFRQKIIDYPNDLREKRQQIKIIVIPLFMVFMTFMLAIFSVMIAIDMANRANRLFLMLPFIKSSMPIFAIYLLIIIALVITWASGTGTLYSMIDHRLEAVISADKDLTQKLFISSVDEIASFGAKINVFINIISLHIKETKEMYQNLNSFQDKLFASIHQATDEISKIDENIAMTTRNFESENKMVFETMQTGEQLIGNVSTAVLHLEKLTKSITDSSSAAEQMIASIIEVSKRTDRVNESTASLARIFDIGYDKTTKTVVSIANLAEKSAELMEINNLISDIASQTNLLAMNAAIEAAHAGDAGKGFSVVADEIRKLAENTAGHTKISEESLKGIITEINNTEQIAREAGETYQEIKKGIDLIGRETISIADTMNEHNRANTEVLNKLLKTKNLTSDLNNLTTDLSTQSKNMLEILKELNEKSSQSLASISDVEVLNRELNKILQNVNELIGETQKIGSHTMTLVNSFKVDKP